MKNRISILLLVLTLLTGFYVKAQDNRQLPIRERIMQAKLREIRVRLRLNQTTFEKFRPIYIRYEQDLANINFRPQVTMMRADADSLTTEEATQLIVDQFESTRKLVTLRENYYKRFKTILTPQQIVKFYQTEADLRRKVAEEMKKRLTNPK